MTVDALDATASFRAVCFEAARRANGRVTEFRLADSVTPNFHQGIVAHRDRSVAVVGSRDLPVLAIAEPRVIAFAPARDAGPLTFVDAPELAAVLAEAPGYRLLTPAELAVPFDVADWPHTSTYDYRFWQPESLGAALFNFWD